ncbi:hypothetical protein E2C01_004083 [Portunus trituberculatus]|uniref:Uncharacterized protein n=1 Tax=Portunus trituberculatus TaxID=210409 RepID=A0A5B7CNX1_PORTR|nr:hypothetical protein [Portunus trituberculatus]
MSKHSGWSVPSSSSSSSSVSQRINNSTNTQQPSNGNDPPSAFESGTHAQYSSSQQTLLGHLYSQRCLTLTALSHSMQLIFVPGLRGTLRETLLLQKLRSDMASLASAEADTFPADARTESEFYRATEGIFQSNAMLFQLAPQQFCYLLHREYPPSTAREARNHHEPKPARRYKFEVPANLPSLKISSSNPSRFITFFQPAL